MLNMAGYPNTHLIAKQASSCDPLFCKDLAILKQNWPPCVHAIEKQLPPDLIFHDDCD